MVKIHKVFLSLQQKKGKPIERLTIAQSRKLLEISGS